MLDSPAGIFATGGLVLSVAVSIGIVLYAISLVLRASHPQQLPANLVETLQEAIAALGRTCESMTNTMRNMVPEGPDLLGSHKVVSAPMQDILDRIMVILYTPAKERTEENYAFLERYATSSMLRTIINAKLIDSGVIETFASEHRTPQETRIHLLKELHRALTEDTDSFPVIPNDTSSLTNPAPARGRSSVAQPPDMGRVVATGDMVYEPAHATQSGPR